MLRTGIIPGEWVIGVIITLYKKKGTAKDPDNYRGITLLSCARKLFTAIINTRLTKYSDAVGIMGDEQAGLDMTTLQWTIYLPYMLLLTYIPAKVRNCTVHLLIIAKPSILLIEFHCGQS